MSHFKTLLRHRPTKAAPCVTSIENRADAVSKSVCLDKSLSFIKRGFKGLAPARPTQIYDLYWKFAAERQNIFLHRQKGSPAPWTQDPILRTYKFTNAYRASDRTSQFLIRHVIYNAPHSGEELTFRILLFKIFNRIETWKLLETMLGEISFRTYSFEDYDRVLTEASEKGQSIYSGAYIMPSGGALCTSGKKHRMHLVLLESMMRDKLPHKLEAAPSLKVIFELLRAYPTFGDFLAYQYAIDLNYSPLINFSEMDFIVPGPGALSGIRKCFSSLGGLTEAEIIRVVTELQEVEFERLGLTFDSLWGRPLQLIDCQNLFCEIDKYSRVSHPELSQGRTRIKQMYRACEEDFSPFYPPDWELNDRIAQFNSLWMKDKECVPSQSKLLFQEKNTAVDNLTHVSLL